MDYLVRKRCLKEKLVSGKLISLLAIFGAPVKPEGVLKQVLCHEQDLVGHIGPES